MNLRELAEADNAIILEDSANGFGTKITLTDLQAIPNQIVVQGQYIRKGVDLDPETGLLVPGSSSAITVRISSVGELIAEGWGVEVVDITGATLKSKVRHVMHDRTLGRTTCILNRG